MEELLAKITLTEIIALSAFGLSCITFGWNLLNELRKLPRARIHCMIANIIAPKPLPPDNNTYFNVSISNVGERPIRIKGIAYEGYKWFWPPWRKSGFVIVPKQLPIYLKDGEDHQELFPYKPKDFQRLLDNNIQVLYAYDSSGREHRMERFRMRKFKNQIKKHLERKAKKQATSK